MEGVFEFELEYLYYSRPYHEHNTYSQASAVDIPPLLLLCIF